MCKAFQVHSLIVSGFPSLVGLGAIFTTSSREDDVGDLWINIGPMYYIGNLRTASLLWDSHTVDSQVSAFSPSWDP